MIFETVDNIFTISLDMVSTTTLAGLLLLLGYYIRKKVKFFEDFCFPAAVIGGFIFSLLTLVFHLTNIVSFNLDTTMQTPFMLVFFTIVGIGGSFALIKSGGKALIIYLVICWSLSIIQNGFGAAMAYVLGLHPLLGVMAGAVSLEGGHGAATAFGPEVEKLGINGAAAVAIASATFGLIAGSLTGGPLAKWLITKNNIKIKTTETKITYDDMVKKQQLTETITSHEFISSMVLIGVLMVFGNVFSGWVKNLGITNLFLPSYVGAMFAAIIFRNVNDKVNLFKINSKIMDIISDISIGFFLTMAMMSLKIWQLFDLALPLMLILVLQVVVLVLITVFILFPLLGKDYDAAVISAGMMGHGLGATPNAVANMGAVCENYNLRSNKAFLIVPLCGAVLIDLVGIPCITIFITMLK